MCYAIDYKCPGKSRGHKIQAHKKRRYLMEAGKGSRTYAFPFQYQYHRPNAYKFR